jgi:hypothetical protein
VGADPGTESIFLWRRTSSIQLTISQEVLAYLSGRSAKRSQRSTKYLSRNTDSNQTALFKNSIEAQVTIDPIQVVEHPG